MVQFDPDQDERDDIDAARKSPLWQNAVAFLRAGLVEIAPDIRKSIAAGGAFGWIAPYHFSWGMSIRNLLREEGFGEEDFKIHNMDNIYVELIEEAMKELT